MFLKNNLKDVLFQAFLIATRDRVSGEAPESQATNENVRSDA